MLRTGTRHLCRSCLRNLALAPRISPTASTSPVASTPRPGNFNAIRSYSSSSSEQPSSPGPPKRPSPYRLLQSHTFLSQFAPLHISGWRLDSIAQQDRLINPLSAVDEALDLEGGDLQDRRLVRAFMMGEGKVGWKDAMIFVQRAGQIIEEEDHHPTTLITPSSDYIPSSTSLQNTGKEDNGYVIEISTHTHTPLPPYPLPTKNPAHKMRPGVTSKDIRLAERLEEVWEGVMGGRQKVEMKKE
ncbi:hypothetical protein L486_07529 [Kwoniella mangroviensis CBS 10435]|uniref:4a-hydroxytetrahydrobiopterin dehydratase n=1 Tax=Kwoniella mangroviensis CBS 10435 TaxID=1331196 RepID=A0A1B9IHL3_9TREE|nr:uncharacterized protein I203_03350 [Kwoniella mangroviensis CBS 8507]OCF54874.1 hypothetical protein L486_07529 [Kwoniella mangroviensis CBS 10435]OCF67653.1 hypothetical protein I203_03350 [Kwoniella mangroviensis CBS 8507]OCF72899.1 hypothetical protein I204_06128 [Kwoniella mangroviensis CBS 8886]